MEEKQEVTRPSGDMFNQFMFGPGRKIESESLQPATNPDQHYIDYGELMVNIDTLMESVKNLKPLFEKAYPFIEQIWKKK
jgi:hypothetical protein